MILCHRCETNDGEHDCPDCDEPTCEDCFEPMTQFNAGTPTSCLTCAGEREHRRWQEDNRRHLEEKAESERKMKRALAAKARRNTPEAIQRRAAARAAAALKKREAARQRQIAMIEAVAKAMRDFGF